MPWYRSISEITYMDNSLTQWLSLIALALVLHSLLMAVAKFVMKRLDAYTQRTSRRWDDMFVSMIKKTSHLAVAITLLYLCAGVLGFSDKSMVFFRNAFKVAVFIQAAIWGNELVAVGLKRYLQRRQQTGQEVTEIHLSAYSAVSVTAKFLLWTVLFLLLLDNLGVNISALVTGLGIGGIAIALAVQNILGDIFASLTIVLDKPFEVGDFIVIGDRQGNVESIGLKTTRIKSLSGEQLVYPNKKLVESDLQNFKRMESRRVVFGIGVVYDLTPDQLKRVNEIVREIFAGISNAKLDRVHLKSFGESSIDYEVVYIVLSSDYTVYMDVQEQINLDLFQRFAQEGIEFAFPTRHLIVSSDDDNKDDIEKVKQSEDAPANNRRKGGSMRPDAATVFS